MFDMERVAVISDSLRLNERRVQSVLQIGNGIAEDRGLPYITSKSPSMMIEVATSAFRELFGAELESLPHDEYNAFLSNVVRIIDEAHEDDDRAIRNRYMAAVDVDDKKEIDRLSNVMNPANIAGRLQEIELIRKERRAQ